MATSYMVLTLPTVSVTSGPEWATSLNAALTLVDSHDHSSGKGVQITPSGLNINDDLDCGSNNLDSVRALRLDNQTSSIVGASDVTCFYALNGDAYYKNASGTDIRLTAGGLVNAGSASTTSHSQVAVASNTAISASDSYVTYLVNTAATRTITLPAANAVGAGRFYIFVDVTGTSETNAITIARTGSDTIDGTGGNLTLSINKGIWAIESDGTSAWYVTRGAPSTLTKSSLTLSTTVLNTTSLTVAGAASLTGTTLTLGSNIFSTTALTLASGTTQTVSSGATVTVASGGTFTAASGATTSITGATLAGTISASGATITSPTITGAGMTTTTLSGATSVPSAATLTAASGATVALASGSTFTRAGSNAKVIIDSQYTRLATGFSTSSGTYVDVTGLTVSLTCVAGDILIIDAGFATMNASGATGVKLMITDGGGSVDPSVAQLSNVTNQVVHQSMAFTYTVVNTGTVTVKAQAKANSAGTSYVYGDTDAHASSRLRVIQYR